MTPDPTPMRTLDVDGYMKLPGNIRQRVREWLVANGIDPVRAVQVWWDAERIEADLLDEAGSRSAGELTYVTETVPHVVPPTWEATQ